MRSILLMLSALTIVMSGHAVAASKKKGSATRRPAVPAAPAPSNATTESSPAASNDSGAPAVRGPTRIDFDDRLIQGQTNKSGAVYLYDRKELKVRSMIKKRDNFRDEIVGSLYDT